MNNQQLSMKIITATILFGSLLAIAGAAIMRLIILLAHNIFAKPKFHTSSSI
jgi:hypothetical protein